MTEPSVPNSFDTATPVPAVTYAQSVERINVGYDLVFTLAGCVLQSLQQPTLNLLVIGVGGGAEIARFLPGNPGWRLTGVDPSRDMLALAQSAVQNLGLEDRVTLVRGTVNDLPAEARFEAATCLFVLHFLPHEGKLALLREVTSRLRPGSPLVLASAALPDDGGLRDDLLGTWQEYGKLKGMPAELMAEMISRLLEQPMSSEAEYRHLLSEAGFSRVTRFFEVLGGGLTGWIAR